MERLWKITSDTFYKQYFLKWRQPMERTYALRAFHDCNRSGLIMVLLLGMASFAVCGMVAYLLHRVFFSKQVDGLIDNV
jgi:hypothetical protein